MPAAVVPIPASLPAGTGVRLLYLSGAPAPAYFDDGKVEGPVLYARVGTFPNLYADPGTYLLKTEPVRGASSKTQVQVGPVGSGTPRDLGFVTREELADALRLALVDLGAAYAQTDSDEQITAQWQFDTSPLGPDGQPLTGGLPPDSVTAAELSDALASLSDDYLSLTHGGTVAGPVDVTGGLTIAGKAVASSAALGEAVTAAQAAATSATAAATYLNSGAADVIVVAASLPGPLQADRELFAPAVSVAFPLRVAAVELTVVRPAEGSSATFGVRRLVRATGAVLPVATITLPAGARRVVWQPAAALDLAAGDSFQVVTLTVGSSYAGSDLAVGVYTPGVTFPTAQAAPGAPTAFDTYLDATLGLVLRWSLPSTGAVRSAVLVDRDGAPYAVLPGGTVQWPDPDANARNLPHTYSIRTANADAVSARASTSYTPTGGAVPYLAAEGRADVQANSLTLTIGADTAVPAGTRAFVTVAASGPLNSGTTAAAWKVTDTAGNTWSTVGALLSDDRTEQVAILTTANSAGLAAGSTVAVVAGADSASAPQLLRIAAQVVAFRGATVSGTLDGSVATGQGGSTRNYTTGSLGTLTAGSVLLTALATTPQTTITYGAPLVLLGKTATAASSNNREVKTAAAQIVASTTTPTVAATGATASPYAMLAVAFRLA